MAIMTRALLMPLMLVMLLWICGCSGKTTIRGSTGTERYELTPEELRHARKVTCDYITAFALKDWKKVDHLHSSMLVTPSGKALALDKVYREKGIWHFNPHLTEDKLSNLCKDKWAIVTGLSEQQWQVILGTAIWRPEGVTQLKEGVWPEKGVVFAIGTEKPLFIAAVRELGGDWRILTQLGTLNEELMPLLRDGHIALTAF